MCQALLANLIERGLPTDRALLFVIDGGKAIRKAIQNTFGNLAPVQRCTIQKRRNVLDHLPEGLRPLDRPQARRQSGAVRLCRGSDRPR